MTIENDNFQRIEELASNTTFYDWVQKENAEIITKLNSMHLYNIAGTGDGIDVVLGATTNAITAGHIKLKLASSVPTHTVAGDLTVTGELNFSGSSDENTGGLRVPATVFRYLGTGGETTGVTVGTFVRLDSNHGTLSSSSEAGLTYACADSGFRAEMIGMVTGISSSPPTGGACGGISIIDITTSGYVTGLTNTFMQSQVGPSGLTTGQVYFLNPSTHYMGGITTEEPQITGLVSKPVLLGITGNQGLLLQYRGQLLSGKTGSTGGDLRSRIMPNVGDNSPYSLGDIVRFNSTDGFTFGSNLTQDFADQTLGIVTKKIESQYLEITTHGIIGDSNVTGNIAPGINYLTEGGNLTNAIPGNVLKPVLIRTPNEIVLVHAPGAGGAVSGLRSGESGGTNRQFNSTEPNPNVEGSELINGSFEIWQRDIGITADFTGTGDTYSADRWYRYYIRNYTGVGAGVSAAKIRRMDFDAGQQDVLGSPNFYTELSHTLASGFSFGNSGDFAGFENRIEGADSYVGQDITISGYLRGATKDVVDLYLKRYYDGTTYDYYKISQLQLGTKFSQFALRFAVPPVPSGKTVSRADGFLGLGLKLNHLTSGATLDLAQWRLYKGFVDPLPEIEKITEEFSQRELARCSRYYQRSYDRSTRTGLVTMFNEVLADFEPVRFTTSPTLSFYYDFPVKMREAPTVSLYSPSSGKVADGYNQSAQRDLTKTSGTVGYNSALRTAAAGVVPITASTVRPGGIRIFCNAGAVAFDDIFVHYVADSDF